MDADFEALLVGGAAAGLSAPQLRTGFAVADRFGATSAPNVFAAGDATGPGNVATAIATGSLAATGLHRTLLAAP